MIVYMSNVGYIAFGDAKCTITLWCKTKFELMKVVETQEELDMGNFVFLNSYRSLGLISGNGELYIWNIIYE